MPKTISAVGRLRQSGGLPDAHGKIGDLLQALAAVECHATLGGPGGVPAGLLNDLVVIIADLAGGPWPEINCERAAAFSVLRLIREPPPLREFDAVLASVLLSRFGLESAQTAA